MPPCSFPYAVPNKKAHVGAQYPTTEISAQVARKTIVLGWLVQALQYFSLTSLSS